MREVVPTGRPVLAVLEGLGAGVELGVLVGPEPPEGWRPWSLEGLAELGCAWEVLGGYFEGAHPIMRYRHVASGRRVELLPAGAWFAGRVGYTCELAELAFARLEHELRRHFPGGVLLTTPATTGRDLWLRAIPWGREWPVLPESLRDLIHETAGQARTEIVQHPELAEIPALYEYDGRLMYGAQRILDGLPGGIPTWERGDRHVYDEWAQGRYLVRVIVPRPWEHPFGLLGVRAERGTWRYPHEPGEQFTTWCDASELHLVGHTWGAASFEILEALTWPRAGHGPLAGWGAALVRIRDAYRNAGELGGLVRAGVRSIVLHGVGALASRSHRETRFAPRAEDLPAESRRRARPEPGGGFTYPADTPPPWVAMQHPELAACVWARARRSLLASPGRSGALHAAGEVLAFRTDAIYTTAPQTWPDDGRPGRFRLKRSGVGPFPRPTTHAELLDLRGGLS